jgi:hypothetical protein
MIQLWSKTAQGNALHRHTLYTIATRKWMDILFQPGQKKHCLSYHLLIHVHPQPTCQITTVSFYEIFSFFHHRYPEIFPLMDTYGSRSKHPRLLMCRFSERTGLREHWNRKAPWSSWQKPMSFRSRFSRTKLSHWHHFPIIFPSFSHHFHTISRSLHARIASHILTSPGSPQAPPWHWSTRLGSSAAAIPARHLDGRSFLMQPNAPQKFQHEHSAKC